MPVALTSWRLTNSIPTNADLIQEADYMLVYAAYEQGRPNADELLKDYRKNIQLPAIATRSVT